MLLAGGFKEIYKRHTFISQIIKSGKYKNGMYSNQGTAPRLMGPTRHLLAEKAQGRSYYMRVKLLKLDQMRTEKTSRN